MYHIVYLTKNLINNKIYVGVHSTWNLNDGYLGSGTILHDEIKKYSQENFHRQILYYCLTRNDAYDIEKRIVDSIFLKRFDVYNKMPGGKGGFIHINNIGRLVSLETRNKISEKAKERIKIKKENGTFYLSINFTLKGKKHSIETKKKMSEWQKNKSFEEKYDKETAEKMKKNISVKAKKRLSKPENNPMFGKKHNESTIEKFKNRKVSEETRSKISESRKNIIYSEETKTKISISNKGKKRSQKSKNNYKLSMAKRSSDPKYCITYKLISPEKIIFILYGRKQLDEIVKKYNLSFNSLYSNKNKGIIKISNKKKHIRKS